MSDLRWISAASKSFTYCGHLLHVIKKLEEKIIKIQEEVVRQKSLVERHKKFIAEVTGNNGGYDTIH